MDVRVASRLSVALLAIFATVRRADGGDQLTAPDDMYNFMVMDVCIDGKGHVLLNLSPIDQDCTRRRKIRSGEPIPYHLHNFPGRGAACKLRLGSVSKDNVPVEKNGVVRIVSFYDQGTDHTCPDAKDEDLAFGRLDEGKEGGSVQWLDDDYAFIMGSWSPVALSYWLTPECATTKTVSGRFFRGWVIGPRKVPPFGQVGWGAFESKHGRGQPDSSANECPRKFNRSFAVWIHDRFKFHVGRSLDTLISTHYSQSDALGLSPGGGLQMERTYWTREFGLTRWEKWAREDWVHPRNGKAAEELAKQNFRSESCGTPYDMPSKLTPTITTGDLNSDGSYSETITLPQTGESHRWLMTLCNDYTNIVKDANGGLQPKWGDAISPTFWLE